MTEPDAETFLALPASFLDGGWPSLDGLKLDKAAQAAAEANRQLAADMASTFGTPHGKRVLAHLVAITLMKSATPGVTGVPIDQIATFAAFREGQNSIVTRILMLVAAGRKDPPPQPRD